MNNRICGLIFAFSVVANVLGGEVAYSARSSAFAVDTEIAINSTLIVDGSMLPFRLDYSPSLWWDETGGGGTARITVNDETVHEATHDGTFLWSPSIVGVYSIKCISANNVTFEKRFNVVAPTVTIEREGYNLCKLTASDGVSEIRYTTDGTAPTADSPLYTEPFEVPPSRLSFVRAATFAVGCPQGEIVFAHFNPVASSVSVAQANCAIDNSGETKMVGYDAIPLPYDTAWEGDSSSSMELRVDGDLIATRTGAGDVAWTPEREGMTTLTLRTVNVAGGTQAEYSAQYDVVPRNVMITEGETPLNERYPGLCQWITNVIVDASVESLGKKADLNTGDWGIVDVDETGKTAAYQSNTIDHNGNTAMSMAVEGPLEWSFKWKVSSEGNFDWLRWSLDGVEKSKISGTGGGWQEVQCVIPEGEHTVCWTYTKDGSASSGDDCGWVAFDLPQSASALFEGCSGLTSVSMPYRFRKLFGDTLNGRPITYIATVQIVVDGEELTTIYVPCGSAIGALPSVQPGEGYSAAFYNADVGGVEIASEMVVNEDMTIYVRWIANEYQMTFDAAGGVVEGEDGHAGRVTLPVTYDSEYGELPTASCDGYVFLGWTLDGAEVTATNIVKTASDHVLTAKWGIQVGNGVWEATICDDPITLGAPLVPPNGEVVIPATIAGRPVAGITAEAFAENDAITGMAVRLAVEGVAEGLLPYVPLYVIVENDEQVIPDAIAANVRKVVFADGVTRIADNWFTCGAMGSSRPAGCPNLETFDIADSVVRIGTNVFEAACALEPSVQNGLKIYQGWCLGFAAAEGGPLVHVTMPDGVRGIAARAFEGEYDIETVAFPSTLRFVGAGAFKDCTGLEDIDLPEGVVAVDREAFRNCTYAQSLILPTTLEEIGAGAFANATSLAGVTVPEGVVDIGDVAFSNCWRMMSATIPASVTNVGAAVFADCRKLTGVTVPLGLGTMAELFPAAYTSIASVSVSDGHAGRVTLPMDVGMFAGCAAMTDLTLPEELGEISDGAFVGCAGMEAFDLPNSVTNIGARAFMGLSQLTAFEFPAGLVAIGESAFSGCSGITALTLPDGLASIGTWAFYGLPQLSRVDIPASVTEIGYGAFGGCERLRSVSLPGDVATVADIMPDAYQLITSAAVTARSEIAPYQIIDSLFEGCEALAVVELPASVTGIGARAFAGCTSLTDAGIPSGVTSLGEEVFVGCTNLSAVSLPMGLTVLSSRMFAGCASLNDVIVPEGVVTLGANVFDGCSALRTVAYVGNAPAYDAAAYVGVPASLVTKVVNGSTGWDGIVTSKALPEFWPVGTSNEITFWEPNRFIVDFVVDGEGAVVTQRVEQVTGTTYMLPADAVRRGAVFGGWWTAADDGGARVTASTQVVLTRPHTFYAHWTFNRYSVHFDANGGEGEMAPQGMTVATGAALAECGFSRTGYAFVGWATEPDGEVVYSDAAEVVDLAYAQNAAVTLYAVWEAHEWTLSDYIDAANLEPVNDETAEWTPDWTTFKVGGVSLRSGTIAAADVGERTLTTLTATVVGEGTGSFWWKVSCEEMDEEYGEWYDYAVFTIDGTEVSKIAGESGWELVEYVVSDAGPHVLAWTFTRDDYDDDETAYDNVAWLDGVVWTPKPVTVTFDAGGAVDGEAPEAVVKYAGYELALPGAGTLANGEYQFMGWTDGVETYTAGSTYVFPSADVMLTAVWELKLWTFGEAVDATQLLLTIGGDADWSVDTANGWTNGVSAKSGAITSGQSSWIETTVSGAGTLGFHWNVMGGIYRSNPFAYAKVEVDGVQQAQEYATDGWKNESLTIEGAGVHTVRWTYLRTSARLADGDCAWLDGLVWTPSEAADPIPAVAVDADASKVNAMVDEVGFADAAVKAAIGGSAEEYNAFKAWAGSVKGTGGDALAGEAAVVANAHAAAAYLLGAERLFENEPTVEIGELAVGERSSGTLAPTMTVAVTVKDGESAVAVSAAKVAAMFEATSDLGDWTGAAKLTPTVTTSGTDAGGKMTFTVVPGDGTASKAFLRIKR